MILEISSAPFSHLLTRQQPSNDNHDHIDCTLSTCSIRDSFYGYRPSLTANAVFLSLFALSLVLYCLQGGRNRRVWGFTVAMVFGTALEVAGYVGRVLMHHNPFTQSPFLLQICSLTIAPAFLAAGIYLCLSRIVTINNPTISRLRPVQYTRIFIPCDIISLTLQGTGGGMASVATQNNHSPDAGDHIMVAGLAFQVFTLSLFIFFSLEYALAVRRHLRAGGDLEPRYAALRASGRYKGFLGALVLATVCIFARSVFRVAELAGGWHGHLMRTQGIFVGLEGVPVIIAVLALNAWHPGVMFPPVEGGKGEGEKDGDA